MYSNEKIDWLYGSDVKYRSKFGIDTIDYFCKAHLYYRISIDYLVISFAVFTRTVNKYENELKNWEYAKCKMIFFSWQIADTEDIDIIYVMLVRSRNKDNN